MVGWCEGTGQSSSAGASYNLDYSRARATALPVGAGGGCLAILFSSVLSFLFLPLFGRRPDID